MLLSLPKDLLGLQADICRLLQAVPRSMSACMREFFQRMPALDPQLRTLLAEWLAYHLSNFDFMWPWAKWSYVLQAPAHDAQRSVVSCLLCILLLTAVTEEQVLKISSFEMESAHRMVHL